MINLLPPSPQCPQWHALAAHQSAMRDVHMRDMFASDPARASRFASHAGPLYIDYSKHRITDETITLLLALARARGVEGWRTRMLAGQAINTSEHRAVLHTALRGSGPAAALAEVEATLKQMRTLCAAIRAGTIGGTAGGAPQTRITDVISIGIGGSDLGPRLVFDALASRRPSADLPRVHFAANSDPADLDDVLAQCVPARTVVIVISKTFTTAETIANGRAARDWLGAHAAHLIAVTNNLKEAQSFGVPPQQVLPMPEWAGGRFSLWSAVGFSIMLGLGEEAFEDLLAGAAAIDAHFIQSPLHANAPVLLALLSVWYSSFWGAQSRAVLPYAQRLALLPAYLQQLEMESNGKRIDRDGQPVDYATTPVVLGGVGANSQHSFHQLFHQGTHLVPCEFIVTHPADDERSRLLAANALAQSAVLMQGDAHDAAYPGNQPSTTIVLPALTAHTLGALLALYEHKVFVEGVLWNLNSFDQPGVELGKRIATRLLPALSGGAVPVETDASTRALLARIVKA